MKRSISISLTSLFFILVFSITSFANTYYVSPTGSDTNPGTIFEPWKTIRKATKTLQPGDTVYVRGGTYREVVYPQNSGTLNEPIAYKAYQGEEVIITYASTTGDLWYQDGVSNIVIEGIIFDGQFHVRRGMNFKNSSHITIRGSIIRNFEDSDHNGGSGIWMSGNNEYFLIEDTQIYHNGSKSNPASENGGNVQIRKGPGVSPGNNDHITFRNCDIYESYTEDGIQIGDNVICNDFLVENSRFWGNKEDGIDIKAVTGALIRNSTFYGHRKSPTGGGVGIMIHAGAQNVIVENCTTYDNRYGFSLGNANGIRPTGNITLRNNVIRNNERGVSGFINMAETNRIQICNNVFYENEEGIDWSWAYPHPYIVNNIFFKNSVLDAHFNSDPRVLDYNDYPEDGKIKFPSGTYTQERVKALGYEIHGMSLHPLFVDAKNYDFHLTSDSPCIDSGSFLTYTTDSGSGDQVPVENANFFCDVYGDLIHLQGQTQTSRVLHIDYYKNIITIDKPLTWYAGQGVSLTYDGTAPDIGAFEHFEDPSPPDPPRGLTIL